MLKHVSYILFSCLGRQLTPQHIPQRYHSNQTERSPNLGQPSNQSSVSHRQNLDETSLKETIELVSNEETPLKEAYRQPSTDLSDVERSFGDIAVDDASAFASRRHQTQSNIEYSSCLDEELVNQIIAQRNSRPYEVSSGNLAGAKPKDPNRPIPGQFAQPV